jgi:hypothetical protein
MGARWQVVGKEHHVHLQPGRLIYRFGRHGTVDQEAVVQPHAIVIRPLEFPSGFRADLESGLDEVCSGGGSGPVTGLSSRR